MAQGILHDFSDKSSCAVYEGDEGYIEIDFGICAGPWIVLSDALAEHICTALGQLLMDRHVRKFGTPEQCAAVIADQVQRAELLADAPGVGCTQTDAADIMDSLAHTSAPPTSAADMTEGELILGRRVSPQ